MSDPVQRVGLIQAGLLSIAAVIVAVQCLGVWSVGLGLGALLPGTYLVIDTIWDWPTGGER